MFGIGIDVCKAALDVAVHEQAVAQFKNTPEGFTQLIQWLQQWPIRHVVLEASGGYERPALDALYEAGLPVVRVNPGRARNYAKGIGRFAKTDRIDAQVLAQMAHSLKLNPYVPAAPWQKRLREYAQRRRHLVQMRSSERQRQENVSDPVLIKMGERLQKQLSEDIAALDKAIAEQMQAQPDWDGFAQLKGAGPVLMATLACELPELGHLNNKAIAALVGLAPMNRDSGNWQGQRGITGGRAVVRDALYMAALSAMRYEPRLRDFYAELKAKGKASKLALTAVMRKMLVILNARRRDALIQAAA